jgi:hypothetical protein
MRDAAGSNHGCRTPRPVARAIRVAIATLCLAVHGCDTASGGAVELSWKLRPASSALPDKFVDCDPPGDPMDPNNPQYKRGSVTQIRLHWSVPVGDTVVQGQEAWSCQDNHGATGFSLPEGTADLLVTPVCGTGADVTDAAPDTYITAATVQRAVTRGATVSLGAVELVVAVTKCATQPCVCAL